jgi:hypothetical protein
MAAVVKDGKVAEWVSIGPDGRERPADYISLRRRRGAVASLRHVGRARATETAHALLHGPLPQRALDLAGRHPFGGMSPPAVLRREHVSKGYWLRVSRTSGRQPNATGRRRVARPSVPRRIESGPPTFSGPRCVHCT